MCCALGNHILLAMIYGIRKPRAPSDRHPVLLSSHNRLSIYCAQNRSVHLVRLFFFATVEYGPGNALRFILFSIDLEMFDKQCSKKTYNRYKMGPNIIPLSFIVNAFTRMCFSPKTSKFIEYHS
jgi:hypothetical protein